MLRRLLENLKLARPRHVFLGEVAVIPQSSFTRSFEKLGQSSMAKDLDIELKQYLIDWLAMPTVPISEGSTNPPANNLAIDVYVCGYRTGLGLWGNIFGVSAIVFWRPKVEVRARLYQINTKHTLNTFSIHKKMRWRQFFNRFCSWRYLLFGWHLSRPIDMEALLGEALIDLMQQVKKSV